MNQPYIESQAYAPSRIVITELDLSFGNIFMLVLKVYLAGLIISMVLGLLFGCCMVVIPLIFGISLPNLDPNMFK